MEGNLSGFEGLSHFEGVWISLQALDVPSADRPGTCDHEGNNSCPSLSCEGYDVDHMMNWTYSPFANLAVNVTVGDHVIAAAACLASSAGTRKYC